MLNRIDLDFIEATFQKGGPLLLSGHKMGGLPFSLQVAAWRVGLTSGKR